jgi:hypothetical protein
MTVESTGDASSCALLSTRPDKAAKPPPRDTRRATTRPFAGVRSYRAHEAAESA